MRLGRRCPHPRRPAPPGGAASGTGDAGRQGARAQGLEAGLVAIIGIGHLLALAPLDVIEQQDDATRFVLIEVYRSPDAAAAHKETAHYAEWRDEVADMMAGICGWTTQRKQKELAHYYERRW